MQVALYSRVSTHEQAVNGYSIEEQIDRMRKYCDAMNWNVYDVYTDAGISGSSTNRPDIQRMISDIKKKRIDKVVVYKLDRLSRSQKDTLQLIEDVFIANNVDFISISENFDTSTAFGKAMIGILAVFAQLEREQIKERMMIGAEGRAKEGRWHGGIVPVGYQYIDGYLKINDYEKIQIQDVFRLFLSGSNICQIEKHMEDKGYKTIRGSWNRKLIRYVLSNSVYTGKIKHGDKIYEGIHEAIISDEDFKKANALLQRNRDNHIYESYHRSIFGGMIFCKKCGSRYSQFTAGKQNGKTYKYYGCYSRTKKHPKMIKDPNCKNKIWRKEELENLVINEIKKLSLEPDAIPDRTKEQESKRKTMLKEIDKMNRKRLRLLDLYVSGKFTAEELDKRIDDLNDQISIIEANLIEGDKILTVKQITDLSSEFVRILDNGTHEQIKKIINLLIRRIEIDNEDVYIYWTFS